jgi:signal transduction histidine kinase
MPDGGEITVVQSLTEKGFSICITDTGCGMAPEELTKITDAFYRVDKSRSRAQGGVGLGLAICQEIAALHGGTLSFESKPGSGTSVMLNAGGDIDEP